MNKKNVVLVLSIMLIMMVTTSMAVPIASARRYRSRRRLTIRSATGGTTYPSPGTRYYSRGSTVTVTAIPDSGYEFAYWQLESTHDSHNPISIYMSSNRYITPVFTEVSAPPAAPPPEPEPDPEPAPTPAPTPPASPPQPRPTFVGFSGYVDSTHDIDAIIQTMKAQNLNLFRMSFNPTWRSGNFPYRASYVQYFLDHCTYTLIVDRNHLYPPTSTSAQTARNNWHTVKTSLLEVLERWPNNPRVMVELINEYISSDYNTRMQGLINSIRSAGYTNGIVVNKWTTSWHKFSDPRDNTYQGYHFYFNTWSVTGATNQMNIALSRGIKVINTEVGADYHEDRSFTTGTVAELEAFLQWCSDRGIGNAVWMYKNLHNWPYYQPLGFNMPS